MYFNPIKQNIHKIKSPIYICKYKETIQDDYLNQIKVYDKPTKYWFNIQPATRSSQIREFGELVKSMKVATIPKTKYLNKFNEFDLAYLDGATPDGELENGENANYRVYAVRNQNAIIVIYFLKIVKND